MSFLRQFVETNATKFISIVLGTITSIIIARALGPTLKGEYSSVFALYEIVVYLSLFGISSSIVYSGARNLEKARKVTFLALFFALTNGAIGTTALVLLALIDNPLNKNVTPEYLLYIAPLTILSIGSSYFSYLLLSRQLVSEMNFAALLSSTLQALAVFSLAAFHLLSIKNLISLNYCVSLVVFVYLLATSLRKIGIRRDFDKALIKEMLTISFKTYLISLMGYIIVRSDVVLLNIFRGNYEVGIYTVAAGLALRILDIPSIAGSLLRPRAIADLRGTIEFQLKVSRIMSAFMAVLLGLAALLIYPAIKILYGNAFLPSVKPFFLLLPGIYFYSAVSQITPYYSASGYPPVTLISPFIAAVSNIFLNFLLIPEYGYNAAAVSSSISYFLFFAIYYVDFYKRERISLRKLLIPDRTDINDLINRLKGTELVRKITRK